MDSQVTPESTDVRRYLEPIRSRWWLILAIVAIATAATYLYYDHKQKEYTASSAVYVQTSPLDRALFGNDNAQDPDRNNQNQAKLLLSRTVAQQVARRLHFAGDPAALLDAVKVTVNSGSDFVTVKATQPTPAGAARLANAFIIEFIKARKAASRADITASKRVAQAELARLNETTPGASAARKALKDRVQRLGVLEGLPVGAAEQVDKALPPGAPSAPKPKRNALFALFVSLVLAFVVVFGLDRLDRRVRRVEEIEELYDLPLLATVAHTRSMAPDAEGRAVLPPDLREAFRTLRTNIELISLDRPVRKILVTSAVPKEGKSSVVRNLALAYREAGARVAVIEADLRQPTMNLLFHLQARSGLTNVLSGEQELSSALEPVAVQTESTILTALKSPSPQMANGGSANGARPGELVVLTSGEATANPPAVLASSRVRELLDQIAAGYDIVLIDSPPVLAVSDAIPLLNAVDGTIVVARLDLSSRDAARRVMELIRRVPDAELLGVVANDAHETKRHRYGTYGAYGSG
jgi:Mrp family chromosome partitioning ATPase/capsular polysaccharide biosynthesis protein